MPLLRTLGPLRLCHQTGDAALGGAKPRRLLAALALNANKVVSAAWLTDVVWGDSLPRSARQNLHTYVWSLRTALAKAGAPGMLIEARAPGYALRIDPDDLDWLRFKRLAAEGSACLAAEPGRASRLLREALSYWQGPVVADVADDLHPLLPQLTSMDEARLAALDKRIAADLEIGRHQELACELSELVAVYPLRERFRAHQMLALYRCGRQSDALAAFHHLRRRLADELGIDPSPEVGELYEAILRADPRCRRRQTTTCVRPCQ
jgi:DNA-binding SARP family transcriptional activator